MGRNEHSNFGGPIADVICAHPEFELLANCRDSFEALQWVEESDPDLLLLDVELPGMNGFELLDTLGSEAPNVIFLSNSPLDALRRVREGSHRSRA